MQHPRGDREAAEDIVRGQGDGDQGREERQDVIASHQGVWECSFVGECSVVCPKHVDPAGAIQRAKVASTIDWYLNLIPWRKK